MDLEADGPSTRRRGPELEAALLDAAWDELTEKGYSGLTFDAVAERAHTSRPVIYRRWSERESLVLAAIRHHYDAEPIDIPDTGSLRGDLYALLRLASDRRADMAVMISAQLAGLFSETGMSLGTARERLLGQGTIWDTVILTRAQERGEIDLDAVPARVQSLPFDLMRHELLMTHEPVSDEFIATVVDEMFLPLVAHHMDYGNGVVPPD
ncbi:TetR/AcrR family transcriptional regulator [Humibacter albus]|uniref:TetR/AcrR family transcriptional regulator n=1 Tax=Humibacter albus TaxID=427754 RepID=UPI0003B62477|nr:TetR/AcrR family transcriptional regulator [Humibacter albus]